MANIKQIKIGETIYDIAATSLDGVLPIAQGGTGATTESDARVNLGFTYSETIPDSTPITGDGSVCFVVDDEPLSITAGGTGATTAAGILSNLGLTATATELNYCDGVTSNIQTQLNNKAASSHGNHVPATQTTNNAVFLRNDNTWATVTPANIGALSTSGGTVSGDLKVTGKTTLGRIDASNEYLTGSLYVGGKSSTTDGKTGVAFGVSGNVTMQGSSAPTLNLIVGTDRSASASIGADSYKRLILKSGEVTRIQVMSNNSTYYQFAGDAFYYTGDNTVYLGGDSKRWKAVYAVTGTINTSDRNQKENIEEIDEKYEALFNKLKPVTYELKGNDHDRIHVGFISQDIKESMDEVGLTDMDFAGYCMDYKKKYNEETGEDELVLDENGNPIESYSLRYTEFIALNTHMIQKLMNKIELLEEEIAQLKNEA